MHVTRMEQTPMHATRETPKHAASMHALDQHA